MANTTRRQEHAADPLCSPQELKRQVRVLPYSLRPSFRAPRCVQWPLESCINQDLCGLFSSHHYSTSTRAALLSPFPQGAQMLALKRMPQLDFLRSQKHEGFFPNWFVFAFRPHLLFFCLPFGAPRCFQWPRRQGKLASAKFSQALGGLFFFPPRAPDRGKRVKQGS